MSKSKTERRLPVTEVQAKLQELERLRKAHTEAQAARAEAAAARDSLANVQARAAAAQRGVRETLATAEQVLLACAELHGKQQGAEARAFAQALKDTAAKVGATLRASSAGSA